MNSSKLKGIRVEKGKTQKNMLGVADIDQHEEFIETITKYQQFANVKNGAIAPRSPSARSCMRGISQT